MRRFFAVVCVTVLLTTPAAAQSALSGTYFGWDGPPGAGGQTYIANINGSAIQILPRGDECARQFYIQGVISVLNPQGKGTLSGLMQRCTNPELFDCGHLVHYEIPVRGDVQLDATTRRVQLNLRYTMEIWNKDTCMKDREEQRTEFLLLLYQPPPPPAPTTTQTIGDIFDDVVEIAIDSFWTLGGLSPR
jgi:hypothetical protein